MSVTLLYFAWVRERVGVQQEEVALDAPTTVGALVEQLAAREPKTCLWIVLETAAGGGEPGLRRLGCSRESGRRSGDLPAGDRRLSACSV